MHFNYNDTRNFHPKLRKLLNWLEYTTGLYFTINNLHTNLISELIEGVEININNVQVCEFLTSYINNTWKLNPKYPDQVCAMTRNIKKHKLALIVRVDDQTVHDQF